MIPYLKSSIKNKKSLKFFSFSYKVFLKKYDILIKQEGYTLYTGRISGGQACIPFGKGIPEIYIIMEDLYYEN
ncbi:hypothetical protein L323_00725 [Ruminiclostridium papyrosolvens C7]|uniref:Uncharacterized protein n=1 Tax=Ruminiclostridium papyrosolvens C7 TaxID=1330534 RepID=U4R6Q8_9FIRM|nr:hypothetical protein L323_00725 [Ruminiclostridium papyrosolvens C7]